MTVCWGADGTAVWSRADPLGPSAAKRSVPPGICDGNIHVISPLPPPPHWIDEHQAIMKFQNKSMLCPHKSWWMKSYWTFSVVFQMFLQKFCCKTCYFPTRSEETWSDWSARKSASGSDQKSSVVSKPVRYYFQNKPGLLGHVTFISGSPLTDILHPS